MIRLFAFWAGTFNDHSVTEAMGRQAAVIAHEWWFFFAVCTTVFIITMLFLARALMKRRTVEDVPLATGPAVLDPRRERTLTIAVSSAMGVTVVTLFVLLFVSISTGASIRHFNSKNAVTIQVMGHQWWWHVIYQNTAASETLQTANEIHVPVGKPVVILTSSNDVIHSFWVPNITGKRDLIPGYSTALWIQADKPGRFRGQCAEFCGHQHAHMAFYIVAQEQNDFDAWERAQINPAVTPAPGSLQEKGMQKFMAGPCVMCHTIRGTDAGGAVGPDLTHVASRSTIAAGTLDFNHENLLKWVRNSQDIKPGNKMPAMQITDDDLNAIVAYLESLK
jgi:cytochrome c oxidase subunit II